MADRVLASIPRRETLGIAERSIESRSEPVDWTVGIALPRITTLDAGVAALA